MGYMFLSFHCESEKAKYSQTLMQLRLSMSQYCWLPTFGNQKIHSTAVAAHLPSHERYKALDRYNPPLFFFMDFSLTGKGKTEQKT